MLETQQSQDAVSPFHRRIDACLKQYAFIQVDCMLREHITDFLEELSRLQTAISSHKAIDAHVQELTEISRTLRFNVSESGGIPSDLQKIVEEMLEYASSVLESVSPHFAAHAGVIRAKVDMLLRLTEEQRE